MIGTVPVVVVALASWFLKKRWALIASVVLGGVAAVDIAVVAIWVVTARDGLGVFTLSYGWYIGLFSMLLMVVATVLQALGLKKPQGGAAGSQPGAGGAAQAREPVAAAWSSGASGESRRSRTTWVSGSPKRTLNSTTRMPFEVIASPQ